MEELDCHCVVWGFADLGVFCDSAVLYITTAEMYDTTFRANVYREGGGICLIHYLKKEKN